MLIGAFVHYDELVQHLEKLLPGTYIFLNEVCLLRGVWADLLDVLRLQLECDMDERQ